LSEIKSASFLQTSRYAGKIQNFPDYDYKISGLLILANQNTTDLVGELYVCGGEHCHPLPNVSVEGGIFCLGLILNFLFFVVLKRILMVLNHWKTGLRRMRIRKMREKQQFDLIGSENYYEVPVRTLLSPRKMMARLYN
jgi:hypothetical protein